MTGIAKIVPKKFKPPEFEKKVSTELSKNPAKAEAEKEKVVS